MTHRYFISFDVFFQTRCKIRVGILSLGESALLARFWKLSLWCQLIEVTKPALNRTYLRDHSLQISQSSFFKPSHCNKTTHLKYDLLRQDTLSHTSPWEAFWPWQSKDLAFLFSCSLSLYVLNLNSPISNLVLPTTEHLLGTCGRDLSSVLASSGKISGAIHGKDLRFIQFLPPAKGW
jgi:hypothetical protein